MTQPWSFVNAWDEKWGGSVGIAALQMNSGMFGQKKDVGLCLDKESGTCIYIISIQQSLSIVFIAYSLSIFCLQTNVHSYLDYIHDIIGPLGACSHRESSCI